MKEIIYLNVNFNKYAPFPVDLPTYMQLPKIFRDKRAIVNVKNNDIFYFLWSIIAALYPSKKNSDQKSSYPDFSNANLKFAGI